MRTAGVCLIVFPAASQRIRIPAWSGLRQFEDGDPPLIKNAVSRISGTGCFDDDTWTPSPSRWVRTDIVAGKSIPATLPRQVLAHAGPLPGTLL